MNEDAPTLALRKLLRYLRSSDGRLRRTGYEWWWRDSVIEAGIRRGLLEATEHGKRKGKHRVIAVRMTEKGRTWRELALIPKERL